MAGTYQHPGLSTASQARHYYYITLPGSQSSASSHDLVSTITDEGFADPAFGPSINGTYCPQLDISEDEDRSVCSRAAVIDVVVMDTHQGATATPWMTTQDRNFNYKNETPYLSIARPWNQQYLDPQGANPAYGDKTQTPLALWEKQTPIEEPFNNIGEVAVKPAHRQQGKPSDQNLPLGGTEMRRGG